MKSSYTTPICVFLFLLMNAGLVVSFNLHIWYPHNNIFYHDWFKLLGAAPAFIATLIFYIIHKKKK